MDRLVDVHCHILPIDDGARDLTQSMEMMREAQRSGITDMIATPHFDAGYPESVDEFLGLRDSAVESLHREMLNEKIDIEIHPAAEIMLHPAICQLPLEKLALGGEFVLVELPREGCPIWLKDTLFQMLRRGYIPVLAHCERYSYLQKDRKLLSHLAESGVIFQVSAGAVMSTAKDRKVIDRMMIDGMVGIIASDVHYNRSIPRLMDVYRSVSNKYGQGYSDILKENAIRILAGKQPKTAFPEKVSLISRIMGAYR